MALNFLAVWAEVKHARHEMWVWVTTDVKTKLIPIIQVGDRSQKATYPVIRELKQCLRTGCTPLFSSDGLKSYFYTSVHLWCGLTANFGRWELIEGKRRPVWVLLSKLGYGQWSNTSADASWSRLNAGSYAGIRMHFGND